MFSKFRTLDNIKDSMRQDAEALQNLRQRNTAVRAQIAQHVERLLQRSGELETENNEAGELFKAVADKLE